MSFKTTSFLSIANRGLNPTISLARTRRVENPDWRIHTFQGTVAGYTTGGIPQIGIDKFPFATDANATDVGDLSVSRRSTNAGQSSAYNGYTSAGFGPTWSNVIDKFNFATNANATDVGDVTFGRYGATGQSSDVSGYTSGGRTDSGVVPYGTSRDNIIDKFPFAADANATNVGDLAGTGGPNTQTGHSSTVSGYSTGGGTNVIDKFPFATDANATDVGDMTVTRGGAIGQSSDVSGYSSGGGVGPTSSNVIDKFPFATNANSTDVGDLTFARSDGAGQSSTLSGYTSGGYSTPATTRNVIDKFPFATNANATDVGDLVTASYSLCGQQD